MTDKTIATPETVDDAAAIGSRVQDVVGDLMQPDELIATLEYISTPDQPSRELGGFHPQTILAAKTALHYLRPVLANAGVDRQEEAK